MAKSFAAGLGMGPLQWNWATELQDALEEIKATDASVDADIAALGQRIAARSAALRSNATTPHRSRTLKFAWSLMMHLHLSSDDGERWVGGAAARALLRITCVVVEGAKRLPHRVRLHEASRAEYLKRAAVEASAVATAPSLNV